MSAQPAVSVVIATHNRPELLAEALTSLEAQTTPEWEAVVVDDGSEPPVDFAHLRERFGSRVRGVRHDKARGTAAARNAGVETAAAPIVAFLDDDDLYASNCLERALSVLSRFPAVDIVFIGLSWFGTAAEWSEGASARAMTRTIRLASGTEVEPGLIRFGRDLFGALLQSVPNAFQHPVVRRNAFIAAGSYHDGCLLCEADWAIRAVLRSESMLVEERLYLARASGQGYFSREERNYDQILSGIEIMDRLLEQFGHLPDREVSEQLRDAASRAWFGLAYHHSMKGELRKALSAWLKSQSRRHRIQRYRFLGRLGYGAILRRPPRPWGED